ncbi:MAG: hypothetical protein LBC27_00490 [Spirochaetaceae bacterium]|jgi:hypothetical protein|nr:hypothetical protein [Spirochaetaceae bacterium]
MKNTIVLTAILLLLGNYLFSQTWTQDENGFDVTYRKITKEEWYRILRQKEAEYKYATLVFQDVLEYDRVQTSPFSGYFYLLGTLEPTTESVEILMFSLGMKTRLECGNKKTGIFVISFINSSYIYGYNIDIYLVGSNTYNRRFNQCIEWVNGK